MNSVFDLLRVRLLAIKPPSYEVRSRCAARALYNKSLVTSLRIVFCISDITGDATLWFDNSIRSDVTGDLVYSAPAMCHIALLRTKVSCALSAKIQRKC